MEPEIHDRFSLDLELGAEPIAGSLTDEQGNSTAFSGWLALARLLERARIRSGVVRLGSPLTDGATKDARRRGQKGPARTTPDD
jgi:hypothetical protein